MRQVSKLKQHVMVLALSAAFAGGALADTVKVSSSKPVASKEVAANTKDLASNSNEAKSDNKTSDTKAGDSKQNPMKFDISQGFSSIASMAIPAVVNVSTTQIIEGGRGGRDGLPQFPQGSPFEDFFKEFFDQLERSPRKVQSLGSGFIIQSDEKTAIIVTNYHVIADAKKVAVFLNDNTELEATVLSFDERTDIALLKVKTDSLPADKRKLPTIDWGDSSGMKVGDWILAIGNPFGLGSTVTFGIISNRAREIGLRSGRNRVNDYVDDFIQHDAAINMGNSGGPLVSLEGKVIGINTAIFSPSGGNIGIGFAIPSALAQDTVNQLMKFGRTKRGWLGVRIQAVTDDIAESLGLGKARGAIVGSVSPEGPAAKAKIEPEDIILEFDGKEVNEKSRLARLVGETSVGKSVKVKLWRKGKEITVDVAVGEFESAPENVVKAEKAKSTAAHKGVEVLGISLVPITDEIKSTYKFTKEPKGVMVMNVDQTSNAYEIGLRGPEKARSAPGDLIEKVNQVEISTPEDFQKAVDDAKKKQRSHILLLVIRDGDPRFVPLKLEEVTKDKDKDKEKDKDKDKEKKKAAAGS